MAKSKDWSNGTAIAFLTLCTLGVLALKYGLRESEDRELRQQIAKYAVLGTDLEDPQVVASATRHAGPLGLGVPSQHVFTIDGTDAKTGRRTRRVLEVDAGSLAWRVLK